MQPNLGGLGLRFAKRLQPAQFCSRSRRASRASPVSFWMSVEETGGSRTVTPLQLVGAGALALSVGALAGFGSHYVGTAKQLAEEGIDPRTRLKFLPVAGKALVASSAMCIALGVLAAGAWKLAGLQYHEIAAVSSWQDAVALAKQQREVIQGEFQKQLFNKQQEER